ncbi:TPA: aromatic acid exporter family protein, partial [Streptococcus pyogenes]
VFETFCGVFVAILVNTDVELIKNKWFNKKHSDVR